MCGIAAHFLCADITNWFGRLEKEATWANRALISNELTRVIKRSTTLSHFGLSPNEYENDGIFPVWITFWLSVNLLNRQIYIQKSNQCEWNTVITNNFKYNANSSRTTVLFWILACWPNPLLHGKVFEIRLSGHFTKCAYCFRSIVTAPPDLYRIIQWSSWKGVRFIPWNSFCFHSEITVTLAMWHCNA